MKMIKQPKKFERVNLCDHILPPIEDAFKRPKLERMSFDATLDEVWESMTEEHKKKCLEKYGFEFEDLHREDTVTEIMKKSQELGKDWLNRDEKSCREDLPKKAEEDFEEQ